MPSSLLSSRVNFAMNCCPLSEIIFLGHLCWVHMWSRKSLVAPEAAREVNVGMKCVCLVNRLTTMKIASYPLESGR